MLPWLLLEFLEDAHRRGVLRQAGAAYQFRHIELQRQLAYRLRGNRRCKMVAAFAVGAAAEEENFYFANPSLAPLTCHGSRAVLTRTPGEPPKAEPGARGGGGCSGSRLDSHTRPDPAVGPRLGSSECPFEKPTVLQTLPALL